MKDIVLKSKLEMAKTLYANGVSLYYISLATGLSWRVLMTELTFIGSHENIRQKAKEGANKQVISSQADSLIKISRIWADFFPANTSNQPI
ncbi:hypothetical protein [Citrobacter portucalensis]|uniref:hypothetical protein n=1 Tax=Citrobacter portucalensis TaxID=1639133 RepID=UPI0021670793|nr:hypothetical protein [Citrobacter portucalensis]